MIKVIKFLKKASVRALLLGCSGALLSGCATVTPSAKESSLEAARVKLMEGAITRDQAVIQPLLAPDFMWREDKAPLEEEPYDFWSRHRLWQEFGGVLRRPLVRKDDMMVAPKESLREGYIGPKIAWRKVGGEWKLAYFYPAPVGSR